MFFRKSKPPAVVKQPKQPPRIVIELHEDGNVLVGCSWPDIKNLEEAERFIPSFAALIFLICNGKLLAPMQHAITIFGAKNSKNTEISKSILVHLQQAIESHGGLIGVEPNKPVVSPIDAFSVRGEQVDD
jgi:hypothetical protein